MTSAFESITKLISEADLNLLMEIASSVADPQELRRLAEDRLSVPSPHSRRSSLALVQKAYLDDVPRCAEPVVLAWQDFRGAVVKVRGVPKDDLLTVLERIEDQEIVDVRQT